MAHVTYKSTLPQRSAKMKAGMPLVVEKTTADATGIARSRSRVDTGAMQGGWVFVMEKPTRGIVSNGQEHSVYNEYGTRHMSSQPMIRPAISQVSAEFFAAVRKLMDW